jgi:hypothetical protein
LVLSRAFGRLTLIRALPGGAFCGLRLACGALRASVRRILRYGLSCVSRCTLCNTLRIILRSVLCCDLRRVLRRTLRHVQRRVLRGIFSHAFCGILRSTLYGILCGALRLLMLRSVSNDVSGLPHAFGCNAFSNAFSNASGLPRALCGASGMSRLFSTRA